MDKCQGLIGDATKKAKIELGNEVKFVFVRLCVLKEYLRKTLDMPNFPIP